MLYTDENMDDYRDPNLDESKSLELVQVNTDYQDTIARKFSPPSSVSQNILTQINEVQHFMPKDQVPFKKTVTERSNRKFTIRVYYFVKRFLTKLSVSRRHKLFFKSIHFQIVGDKASGEVEKLGQNRIHAKKHKKNEKYQFLENCTNPLTLLLRCLPIVYPQSVKKVIWDLCLCLVLIYFFVMIPLELAFNTGILFKLSVMVTIPFFLFLIVDYLMKMITVYYEYGQPIIDRSLIFNNYLTQGLIIDGISLLVILLGIFNQYYINNRWLNLPLFLFITQYHYFAQVIKNVEESINISKIQSSILNLAKLIFTILYFLHLYSCLWYYIGQYANSVDMVNWLDARNMSNAPYYEVYLEAFYFSTVTMISVGYGDIVPLNPIEKICTILFMFTTCVQLSFSVNTVGEILNSISIAAGNTTEKIRIINKYMNRKRISFELQYQIREYIKIYWSQQLQQENEEEEKLIISLSENLRNKLIHEANYSIIEKCELFQQTFSSDTKQKLIKLFKSVLISPEQTISCILPQYNEPCLCFIDFGSLNLCTNIQERSEVVTFQQGSFFGVEELLTGQQSQLFLQSQSFVKLLILTRTDFLQTLKENPKDYESYCLLKDELQNHQRDSQIKCKSCNCLGHDIQNCPIVHFVIDKEKIIKSYQYQQIQKRQSGLRNRFRIRNQFNATFDQWYLSEVANTIKNTEEIPLGQFYNIQITDSQPKIDKAVSQSRDSFYTNDRGSMLIVDTIIQNSNNNSFGNSPSPPKAHEHSIFYPQQKIIRRTFPRQSIRIKNQGIKHKFQRIIKKLIKMQTYSKAFNKNNEIQTSEIFNNSIREIVENYFSHPQLNQCLNKKDYEDLYFLKLKCQLIQFKEPHLPKSFEVQKEFQIYQTHNNISSVIKKADWIIEQLKSKQLQSSDLDLKPTLIDTERRKNILKESLIRYISFPNVYFQKYFDLEKPVSTPQSLLQGQKKAKALFRAYKKRMIQRQNAIALPFQRQETRSLKRALDLKINSIAPDIQ